MIRLISSSFVPVAVDLIVIQGAKTPEGDLYRSIKKQRPQYQGLWFVAPDGNVLGGFMAPKNPQTWTLEIHTAIEETLKAFGPVTPRKAERIDLHPFRGIGVRPDGSVNLAVSVREIALDKLSTTGPYDSITFSAKEWTAFAPPRAETGTRWTLPTDVARRVSRCLSPLTDLTFVPRPEDVTEAEIRAAVVSVENGVATLAYRGSLAAVRKHPSVPGKTLSANGDLRGTATFDVKTGQMLSITLILDGTFRNYPPYDKDAVTTVAGAEWRRERTKTIR
jgi:hypothetical protein